MFQYFQTTKILVQMKKKNFIFQLLELMSGGSPLYTHCSLLGFSDRRKYSTALVAVIGKLEWSKLSQKPAVW